MTSPCGLERAEDPISARSKSVLHVTGVDRLPQLILLAMGRSRTAQCCRQLVVKVIEGPQACVTL